jgi:hypothetical protein
VAIEPDWSIAMMMFHWFCRCWRLKNEAVSG